VRKRLEGSNPSLSAIIRIAENGEMLVMRTEGSTRFAWSKSERREAAARRAECRDARSNPFLSAISFSKRLVV
jgi:hypothetical protein